MTTFTKEEVEAIYELLDQLSGGNPEYGFSWDGEDSLEDPTTSALVKIFKVKGRSIPENLEEK